MGTIDTPNTQAILLDTHIHTINGDDDVITAIRKTIQNIVKLSLGQFKGSVVKDRNCCQVDGLTNSQWLQYQGARNGWVTGGIDTADRSSDFNKIRGELNIAAQCNNGFIDRQCLGEIHELNITALTRYSLFANAHGQTIEFYQIDPGGRTYGCGRCSKLSYLQVQRLRR